VSRVEYFIEHYLGPTASLIVMLVVGAGAFFTLKGQVEYQSKRLEGIETTILRVQDILIKVAVQDERLAAMDQRSLMQGQRIDESRRSIDEILKTINTRMDDLSRRIDTAAHPERKTS
jgi:hypothetical protein